MTPEQIERLKALSVGDWIDGPLRADLRALRAVVKLHHEYHFLPECRECHSVWPCSTIRVIQKEVIDA